MYAGLPDDAIMPDYAGLPADAGTAGHNPEPYDDNQPINGVPKWGRKHPNIYAGAMTALDMAPTLAAFTANPVTGIPLAGAINTGAKSVQRMITGEDQDAGTSVMDFAKGATVEGIGRGAGAVIQGVSNIPAVRAKGNAVANWIMRSAGKFGTGGGLKPAEQKAMAKTILEKGYLFNDSSYDDLISNVVKNKEAVDSIYDVATKKGDIIPATDPMSNSSLASLLERGQNVRGVDPGYTGNVQRTINDFVKEGPYSPTSLSVSKRQLDQNTRNARSNMQVNDATESSQKALADGIRQTLHTKYPESAPYDLDSSQMLDLEPYFARAINRISQRDMIGLGEKVMLGGMKGNLEEVTPGTVGKLLAFVWDRPEVKSRVAKMMYEKATGRNLPISQWKKGLNYLGQAVNSAPVRGAFDAAVLSSDPLGIRSEE